MSDFFLLIGIVGGLIVGYLGNELVLLTSRIFSRTSCKDAHVEGRTIRMKQVYDGILLWFFRRRYFAVTIFVAPILLAWLAFGLFYGIGVIWVQSNLQVRCVHMLVETARRSTPLGGCSRRHSS